QIRGASQRQRCVRLAVRHLEAHHRRAVLLLERLHFRARLDHHDAERPARELAPAREDRVDDRFRLRELYRRHAASPMKRRQTAWFATTGEAGTKPGSNTRSAMTWQRFMSRCSCGA